MVGLKCPSPQVEIVSIDLKKGPRLAPMDPTSLQCSVLVMVYKYFYGPESGIDAFPGINVPPFQVFGNTLDEHSPYM